MINPKISVAMCTYNGGQYLKEQLDSILAQTLLPDELVIFDDASSDNTINIIEEFKGRCGFFVDLTVNDENSGVVKNFEKAISKCTGDIIFLSDQDDVWSFNKIDLFIDVFQGNPSCGYVFSNASLVDQHGDSLGNDLWASVGFSDARRETYASGQQLEVMLKGGNFVYGMAMAFRSSFVDVLLPIESNSSEMTHDTWLAILLSGFGAYGVAICEHLVKYRQHPSQQVGAGVKRGVWEFFICSLKLNAKLDNGFVVALIAASVRLNEIGALGYETELSAFALSDKAKHLSNRRNAINCGGRDRFKFVFLELLSGRYRKYSRFIITAVKDLFYIK